MQPGEYKLSVVEQILGTVDDVAFEAEPYDVTITVETATGIDAINAESGIHNLYNLQGVRVNKDYKGIVISDGKKILVK